MWVWLRPKLHMILVIFTFYVSMCLVSATNSSAPFDLKNSSLLHLEGSIPEDIGVYKESILHEPKRRNFSFLSANMKDYISFINSRAAEYNVKRSDETEEPKVVVDLDQTKVDVMGRLPESGAIFMKKLTEEGMVVDIPKSSLFREKRKKKSTASTTINTKKMPPQMRLFYKTSTPRFRQSLHDFETTNVMSKFYKAFVYPLRKKMRKNKHHPHRTNKRGNENLKPIGVLNMGERDVPKICHASHQSYYQCSRYPNRSKKMRFKTASERRDRRSTRTSLQALKKSHEISEAALFQMINKLIKDSAEVKTADSIEINIATSMTGLINSTKPLECSNSGGTQPSYCTGNSNFQVAVIIAKITHEPENNSSITSGSTTRKSTTLSSTCKYRCDSSSSSSTTANTTSSRPVLTSTLSVFDCYPHRNLDTSRSTQRHPKETLNGLLKEIIRHVSIALDAVTTSKEFLDLISCSTVSNASKSAATCCTKTTFTRNGKSTTTSGSETWPKKYNPLCPTTEIKTSSLETTETDNTGKTKDFYQTPDDICFEPIITSTEYSTTGTGSSTGETDTSSKNASTCEKNGRSSTDAVCERSSSSSSECSVVLDEEDEYFEAVSKNGWPPYLIVPEDGCAAEAYHTASYESDEGIPFKVKRKNNETENEREEVGDAKEYKAKELMKELERYHMMLQDPIVTKIWPSFQHTKISSVSQYPLYPPINKINKRKPQIDMKISKIIQNVNKFQSSKPNLINRNFKETEGFQSSRLKVNSVVENILEKLNISSDTSGREKRRRSMKIFDTGGFGNMSVPDPRRMKEKYCDEIPRPWDWKQKNVKSTCCPKGRQNEKSKARLEYNQELDKRMGLAIDKRRGGLLAQVISRLHTCPSTTPFYLLDLPSIPVNEG